MLIIFDLDGTLADDRHRQHFLNEPIERGDKPSSRDWDAYYKACGGDNVFGAVRDTAVALANTRAHTIEIWTGRRNSERMVTEMWLRHYGIPFNKLRMRDNSDYTKNVALKLRWLEKTLKYSSDPEQKVLIFDDHPGVIEAFRELGHNAFHVRDRGY